MKRLAVFCGASTQVDAGYLAVARELGQQLAASGIELVYGGASVGLMGAVASGALENGGHVIGVMPDFMSSVEVTHQHIQDIRIVRSLHERKQLMADLSDGFIALPGGYGTLDELFEIVTWKQIGLHQKPIGILNFLSYFDPLLQFRDHAIRTGFVRLEPRDLFIVSDTIPDLVARLQTLGCASISK